MERTNEHLHGLSRRLCFLCENSFFSARVDIQVLWDYEYQRATRCCSRWYYRSAFGGARRGASGSIQVRHVWRISYLTTERQLLEVYMARLRSYAYCPAAHTSRHMLATSRYNALQYLTRAVLYLWFALSKVQSTWVMLQAVASYENVIARSRQRFRCCACCAPTIRSCLMCSVIVRENRTSVPGVYGDFKHSHRKRSVENFRDRGQRKRDIIVQHNLSGLRLQALCGIYLHGRTMKSI